MSLYLQFLNLCESVNFHFLFHLKTKFWYKEMPTPLQGKKTGWYQWALVFLWTSTWSWPLPIYMRSPKPDPPTLCGRH